MRVWERQCVCEKQRGRETADKHTFIHGWILQNFDEHMYFPTDVLLYVCTHTSVYTYMLDIHIYVYIYVCVYTHMCVYTCTYMYMSARFMCVEVHTYIHTYTHTYVFMYTRHTHIYQSDMYMYIQVRTCETMGWLRWVGSLKLEVSFAKEPFQETIFCKRDL